MLSRRLLVSAILIPLAVGLFVLDASLGRVAPIFGVVCVLLSTLMASEMVTMLRPRFGDFSKADVVVAVGLMVLLGWTAQVLPSTLSDSDIQITNYGRPWTQFLSSWIDSERSRNSGLGWLSATLLGAGLSMCVVATFGIGWLLSSAIRVERGTRDLGEIVSRIGAKLFVLAYVGGTVQLTSQIRWISRDDYQSMRLLAALLIATKLGDVGAYFTGRLFGKRHPLKRLSPGKTGAGFVGAVITGAVCTGAWLVMTESRAGGYEYNLFVLYSFVGAVMAVLGIIGDLVESLIKRDVGVKDASDSLPGFGGVLDLLDSTLFVGSLLVAIFCLVIFGTLMLFE